MSALMDGDGPSPPGKAFNNVDDDSSIRYRRALLWPIALLLLIAIGWTVLLTNLEKQKRGHEETALSEAAILSRGYANHLQQSLAAVDQISLYIKYAWEFSGGTFRLENIDEAGILPADSGFYVGIIDRDGDLITSTGKRRSNVDANNEPYFVAQRDATEDHFYIGKIRYGIFSKRSSAHFSRRLVDRAGEFDGIVLVSVPPEYFIAGYDETSLGENGLLAILGTDKSIRVTRIGNTVFKPETQAVLAIPPINGASGARFVSGGPWFSDRRSRYVGWQVTDRYGMIVLAGLDQEAALAPYREHRATSIRHAIWATLALATFGVIAMCLSVRLIARRRQLEDMRSTYRMATEGGYDGFYISRPVRAPNGQINDFRIIDCNRRGAEFNKLRREELIGKRISEIFEGEAREMVMRTLCEAFHAGVFEGEQEHPADSSLTARWVNVRVVRSGDDLAVTLRDISDTKAHVIELEKRGNEDALTGLPNRHWMNDFLPRAVQRASENKAALGVLFIDLDGFKAINDTLGHEAGDELLRNAARRLKLAVRPHDHVVRIGGDEFVVILENFAGMAGAAHVAERILAAFRETFRLAQGIHSVGTSIGISIFPDDAGDAASLMKHADIAMYSVKTSGKRNYRFFDEKFYEAVRIRHEREADLRHAIESDQFVVYYQPRIDMSTGAMSSMEALVRWAHPLKGLIEPLEFIPLAEETGLIVPLGEQVIGKVCAQLAHWAGREHDVLPVSINVSARQFNEAKIADVLAKALAQHNVNPGLVEIELTESAMMDSTLVVEKLEAIRKMGVKLLVDDFGTGYSSLSQLQELHFDVLKVDKAFTARLQKTKEGQTLFTAIITMAHSLGMRVVAEGVETQEQVETLKLIQCDEVQGFYVSKPLPPAENQPVFRDWAIPAVA